MREAVARAYNCASLGLAFTAIGLFLMLLWTSAQAVPASLEKSLPSEHQRQDTNDLKLLQTSTDRKLNIELGCSPLNYKLCKYTEEKSILKRMKHRSNIRAYSNDNSNNHNNEPIIKSSKSLHERQVRSFEHSNKITRHKLPHDKNTFVSYESTKTNYNLIRNISLDDKVMNNGESMSMENVSEPTLATFKESDVKTNAQKETSDKIYSHVNGELQTCFPQMLIRRLPPIFFCLQFFPLSPLLLQHSFNLATKCAPAIHFGNWENCLPREVIKLSLLMTFEFFFSFFSSSARF